jgi:hypothetical protein
MSKFEKGTIKREDKGILIVEFSVWRAPMIS